MPNVSERLTSVCLKNEYLKGVFILISPFYIITGTQGLFLRNLFFKE